MSVRSDDRNNVSTLQVCMVKIGNHKEDRVGGKNE